MTGLRWLAQSRARLFIAGLVFYALLFGLARPLTDHIRFNSTSVVQDTSMLTFWLLLLLLGALCIAIGLCDVAFGEAWRRRVVLGERITSAVNDDATLSQLAIPKNRFFEMSVVLASLFALGGSGLELVTDDFLDDYQRVGHKRTILRSDNHSLKLELVDELATVYRERFVRDAIGLLDLVWRDESQPEEVRVEALAAFGRLSHSVVTSMRSWVKQDVLQHWERDVVTELRDEIQPDLIRFLKTAPPSSELTRHGYFMLGKLRGSKGTELLLKRTQDTSKPRDDAWRAAVVSLGLGQDPRAIKPLTGLFDGAQAPATPEDLHALSFALGELTRHYRVGSEERFDDDLRNVSVSVARFALDPTALPQELSHAVATCAVADVMRKTGDADIAGPLFKIFNGPTGEAACAAIHVDTGEKAVELVVQAEPLRLRILRGLALVAVGNAEVLDWTKAQLKASNGDEFTDAQLRRLIELAESAGARRD